MMRYIACVTVAAVVLAGCGSKQEAAAGTMTAEEHARMQAGGNAGSAQRAPVHLSAEQARAIGVTFTVAQRGPLVRTVRTMGQVVPAEPNLAEITTKIDGFVEQLLVNATGTFVRRREPLLTLYSPMLVAAQEELVAAKRLAAAVDTNDVEAWRSGQALVEASRRRLSYWDISKEQIDRLERTGEVRKTLTLDAPFDGVVLEKMVVQGQAVEPGMKLYRLANLAKVWIEGAVFEQDLGLVRAGAPVSAEFTAFPGRAFPGRVSFVWPLVDSTSRSGRVRVEFANRDGELRPGMYATLLLEAVVARDALLVPAEAVVQTGERDLVFVVGPSGALEPRSVELGPRAGDHFQIRAGLMEGDRVVASANFLVDAESRLRTGAGTADMPGMIMGGEKRP